LSTLKIGVHPSNQKNIIITTHETPIETLYPKTSNPKPNDGSKSLNEKIAT
jgi:Icc-related predicted phosphoesterase